MLCQPSASSSSWIKANQAFEWNENKDQRKKSNKSKKMDKIMADAEAWSESHQKGEAKFAEWTPSKESETEKPSPRAHKAIVQVESDTTEDRPVHPFFNPKKRKHSEVEPASHNELGTEGMEAKRRKFKDLSASERSVRLIPLTEL